MLNLKKEKKIFQALTRIRGMRFTVVFKTRTFPIRTPDYCSYKSHLLINNLVILISIYFVFEKNIRLVYLFKLMFSFFYVK
jgi:hypothetical protein